MSFNNDIKDQSQLDPGGVLRSAHSDASRALRVVDAKALAKNGLTHFSVSYDENNNPTKIDYKLGTKTEIANISFIDDVSGSLKDTYFYISSGRNTNKYYIWYNVDSTGTDPNTLRYSNDNTKTILKFKTRFLSSVQGYNKYKHEEIVEVLKNEEWFNSQQ